ncbi:MAG: diaminohydroxyphosphoribosylaminopyrimidine deaminase [Spirosomataceae bacterium]|jgi:diaminohydroxyphosphoribosylaminopyrimidine deaminase/5-amino-6-(5-phosphoribosylamino)uracil reductase
MTDSLCMQRALELASLGKRFASPNPMVGCVIVHNNKIIGEGWHQRYGEAHAEVNAIADVKDKSLLSEATAYVTLEPCAHFGKTPPCADLLIQHKLKRVVICNEDPFSLVDGRGIEKLRNAGIEVEAGLLALEGRELNKRFFTAVKQKRPYIILKWAETADGFIAAEDGKPIQITGELSRQLVHKWRTEEPAIMIGTNTALNDNPRLNVRYWVGRNPTRVVIDRRLQIPPNFKLLDNTQKTLIFNDVKSTEEKFNSFIQVPNQKPYLPFILDKLLALNLQSIFVEGGTTLLQHFINAGLFDEIRIFKNLKTIGAGIPAPILPHRITLTSSQLIEPDELRIFRP